MCKQLLIDYVRCCLHILSCDTSSKREELEELWEAVQQEQIALSQRLQLRQHMILFEKKTGAALEVSLIPCCLSPGSSKQRCQQKGPKVLTWLLATLQGDCTCLCPDNAAPLVCANCSHLFRQHVKLLCFVTQHKQLPMRHILGSCLCCMTRQSSLTCSLNRWEQ